MHKYCLKHIKNKYKSIFAVYMYIFIFMVHLSFFIHVHLFGLWVLEIYIQWKKCTSLLFVFQYFFFFCFFLFLDYFAFL